MKTSKFIIILLSIIACSSISSALEPDQIAILVNSSDDDSTLLADYYCEKRGVPRENILSIPMPLEERISRDAYDVDIAPSIREWLKKNNRQETITCILTVKGVPLRINSYVPKGETAQWRKLINQQINQRFGELKQLGDEFENLISPLASNLSNSQNFRLKGTGIQRLQNGTRMIREVTQTAQKTQQLLSARQGMLGYQEKMQQFQKLAVTFGGLNLLKRSQEQNILTASDKPARNQRQDDLDDTDTKLNEYAEELKTIEQEPLDVKKQERRYELIFQIAGLQGLCNVLLNDRSQIDDEQSDAAFDSELSLILWPPYRLSDQQPNHLLAHDYPVGRDYPDVDHKEPTLMVSRLDGPTQKIARELIDRALAAENMTLDGNTYIDARGIYDQIDTTGTYGNYDDKVRKTADLIRNMTSIPVTQNNQEKLFEPGECPNTILYCGWWSVKKYIDSFTFLTGAVGYHIASFEAATLRDQGPDGSLNNVWCKRMLEEGITATLGAVNEPYLYTMPRPDLFFGDLLSGEYCLVECFYRSKPYNSWMLTLIGDPLYQPRFAGSDTDASASPSPGEKTRPTKPAIRPKTTKKEPVIPAKPQKDKKPGGFKPAF